MEGKAQLIMDCQRTEIFQNPTAYNMNDLEGSDIIGWKVRLSRRPDH